MTRSNQPELLEVLEKAYVSLGSLTFWIDDIHHERREDQMRFWLNRASAQIEVAINAARAAIAKATE